MKYIVLSCFIFTLISSCCYNKYRIASLRIIYSNVINTETEIHAYSVDSSTFENPVAHSNSILKSSSDYSFYLDADYPNSENNNYIIILGDSIRIDTISNINYKRYGRCNNKIDFTYIYKNIVKINDELVIY